MDADEVISPPALPQTFGSLRATINQEPAWYLWSHAIRDHHTKYHPRSLGPGMGERKGHSSMPFLMAGTGSFQPSTTCDTTKSPDTGQLASLW